MDKAIIDQLAPNGVLRAGVNLGNILLVTDRTEAGDPIGVSPDMARALADRLGVSVQYVTYPSPGAVADAVAGDNWDIGLIAVEPKRAETVTFSPAYTEIEATYLVPESSGAVSLEDIDMPGMRIAVSDRSAYDLYLSRTLQNATLLRGEGLAGTVDLFVAEELDALAGLRPALLENAKELAGARVLDGRFTTVRQAIGVHPENTEAAKFVADFVHTVRTDGTVQGLIDRHGMTGRLNVGTD
ncbi:MAG: transporter substrate-binding domain-containing protein [Pseudomonadota bacterium]